MVPGVDQLYSHILTPWQPKLLLNKIWSQGTEDIVTSPRRIVNSNNNNIITSYNHHGTGKGTDIENTQKLRS